LFSHAVSGQQQWQEAALRSELSGRGVDENLLQQELLKKGIDPSRINPSNMQQMQEAEAAVRQVIDSLSRIAAIKSKSESSPKSNIFEGAKKDTLPVKDTSGKKIPFSQKKDKTEKDTIMPQEIYGQHIFKKYNLEVIKDNKNVQIPETYVLGPGDKVTISIWGESRENMTLVIQQEGYIQPSGLSRFYIAGLTLKDAREMLAVQFRKYYPFRRENFEVKVTSQREISVNIFGEVENNGTFAMSAVNTAINALMTAGGVTEIGSVRKIQITRAGQKPRILDIYAFLKNPALSQQYYLNENDFIFVPVAEKMVSVSGEVKRPCGYELLEKENLKELIEYAGGLTIDAIRNNIQILRTEGDSLRIIDVDLTSLNKAGKNFELKNGDKINIQKIVSEAENTVKVTGAVSFPGTYAISESPRLSELLKKVILKPNAITNIAYIKRLNDDQATIRYELVRLDESLVTPGSSGDILLKRGDELIISSKASFVTKAKVSVEGSVRNPQEIELDEKKNLKVSDLIFLSGGLMDDATSFAYLFRKGMDTLQSPEYIFIDLDKALKDKGSAENILLEPNDQLVVFSQNNFRDKSTVTIGGAVRKPGEFPYHESLTLKDILLLSGGLKREAATDRIDVFRINFTDNKKSRALIARLKIEDDQLSGGDGKFALQPFDQVYVRYAPEFELQRNIYIDGEVRYPGTYALLDYNTRISTLVQEAGGVTQESFLRGATLYRNKDGVGYVIFNLEKAIKQPDSEDNVILQDGDEIYIPKINNIVSIEGAINAYEWYPEKIANQGKINVNYRKGKSAWYYIEEYAGGISQNASKNKISVVDATGKVFKTKSYLIYRKYPKVTPGSTIRVGFKEARLEKEGKSKDIKWGEILANSIAQATAILSLILLIQNVN